jgi:GH15 family glucan-1,4-alpha-glucosidase
MTEDGEGVQADCNGAAGPAGRGPAQAAVTAMLALQSANGALVASPDFAQYHYCWLRDSSFAAYALDRCGQHDASARYHAWAAAAIDGIGDRMDTATAQREAGAPVDREALPPTRFGLDGSAANDDWPNFQIDGYGTWLWALREHLSRSGRGPGREHGLPDALRRSAARAARFLAAFALDACYDVWEENADAVHTSTLACVYGGLTAAAGLLGDRALAARAGQVRSHVRTTAAAAGRYQKSSMSQEVDASMLWLATPFSLVDRDDPLFAAAVREITARLDLDGGIRRFPSDTFYGGGAWPVLTASLGWHLAAAGEHAAARRCLAWVAGRIDADGRLGEQFGGEKRLPEMYREWVDRWGHPARDLLWSHAMYAVLSTELSASDGALSSDDPTFLRLQ